MLRIISHQTVFAFLILLILPVYGFCQYGSLLFVKNGHRQVQYKPGEKISFRVRGDDAKISDVILGFEDSVIVFHGYKINPKRISRIYVDDKTKVWFILRYKYERIFLFSGTAYFLLDAINSGDVKSETALISATLCTAGLVARWLIDDTIKIRGKRRLDIINKN